jgi:peptidyl-prolyl cis-trans isomerase D
MRIFQHILFQVPPNAAPTVDAQKRRQAEQLLPQARSAGARFAQLASRYSDDPGSKVQGGSLGLSGRGQFVAPFEDAAWQLAPGGVSPVIKSPFGYHIIRRPPLAEVRDSFRTGIEERLQFHGDSLYLDSLTIKRRIKPVSRAPAYVRAAMQDIDASRTSGRTLVNYRGGSVRVRDLVRWVAAMDPSVVQALPQANDDQINQFLKAITQRELLVKQADSAKITLTPEDLQQIRTEHDSAITLLGSILSLSPEVLRDSVGHDQRDRVNFAMGRVNDYMDRVVQGRARFFPVPPFLGQTLRDHADWSVDEAGVRRAVERAQQLRGDSTRAGVGAAPRIAPAPGPAPIDTTRRPPR